MLVLLYRFFISNTVEHHTGGQIDTDLLVDDEEATQSHAIRGEYIVLV